MTIPKLKKLNIITPVSRPHLLQNLYNQIIKNNLDIKWHLIFHNWDDYSKASKVAQELYKYNIINHFIVPTDKYKMVECYDKVNKLMLNNTIKDEEWCCILCDDDGISNKCYEYIFNEKIEEKAIFLPIKYEEEKRILTREIDTTQIIEKIEEKAIFIPIKYMEEQRIWTREIDTTQIIPHYIGFQQIIAKAEIFRKYPYNLNYHYADGIFAKEVFNNELKSFIVTNEKSYIHYNEFMEGKEWSKFQVFNNKGIQE